MTHCTTRRMFLGSSAAAAAAAAMPRGATAQQPPAPRPLKPGAVVLFQGDSITDAGRNRAAQQQPNHAAAMGYGYPLLISSYLLAIHPALKLRFYNRGISGNKVPDLDARWQADGLDLKPDILSILIGVNDLWHKLGGQYDGTVEQYDQQLGALLKRTKQALPDTTIVLCDPFVLRCGAINESWFPEFDQRRAAARKQAQAHGALFVPFQQMFDDAVAKGSEPAYWAADGVHPTMAGHMLMAMTWGQTVLG